MYIVIIIIINPSILVFLKLKNKPENLNIDTLIQFYKKNIQNFKNYVQISKNKFSV